MTEKAPLIPAILILYCPCILIDEVVTFLCAFYMLLQKRSDQ